MTTKINNKKRVLLLFAHPSLRRSEVNRPMFDIAKNINGVTAIDLYSIYPSFQINIDREQQLLRDHDVIVFQFPLYWYSTPSLLKEWQDLVLEHGFAYGSGGNALAGKKFMCALTAGGPEKAYKKEGYNHFTIGQLLQPLEQMANLCQMEFQQPFTLFGSRTAVEDNRLHSCLVKWEITLTQLVNGENLANTNNAEVGEKKL